MVNYDSREKVKGIVRQKSALLSFDSRFWLTYILANNSVRRKNFDSDCDKSLYVFETHHQMVN